MGSLENSFMHDRLCIFVILKIHSFLSINLTISIYAILKFTFSAHGRHIAFFSTCCHIFVIHFFLDFSLLRRYQFMLYDVHCLAVAAYFWMFRKYFIFKCRSYALAERIARWHRQKQARDRKWWPKYEYTEGGDGRDSATNCKTNRGSLDGKASIFLFFLFLHIEPHKCVGVDGNVNIIFVHGNVKVFFTGNKIFEAFFLSMIKSSWTVYYLNIRRL